MSSTADAAPSGPPAGLVGTVNGTTVTLTWQPAPSSPLIPVNSYVIEAGTTSGASDITIFDTGSTATTFTTTGVPAGTYYVRVRARNGGGTSAVSNETVLTLGGGPRPGPGPCTSSPNAPSNLTASVGGASVVLSWTPPTVGCAPTGYIIEAGSSSGTSNLASFDNGVSGTTFSASDIATGVYFVRVRAANAYGQSGATNEVVVTIGPAVGGTYVLERVDGQPLPVATIPSPPNPCTGFTDSAQLILNANLTYRLTSHEHIECQMGPGPVFDTRETGRWSTQNLVIAFTPDGTGAYNLRPATVSGSTLILRFDAPHQNAGVGPYTFTGTWRKQ